MSEKVILQYYDRQLGKPVTVTPDTPLPMGGSSAPSPGSVTTDMLADGAVTDDKLAKPKVDVPSGIQPKMVIGTTLSTNVIGMVGYSQDPLADNLVMYNFGGQVKTAAPTADNDATTKQYVDNAVNGAKLTAMTASEAQTGTATTARSITATVLKAGAVAAVKTKPEVAALTPIADPSSATLEDVATLLNAVVAAMKA